MGNLRGALLAVLAISCAGAPPRPTSPDAARGTPLAGTSQRAYTPMSIKADAKAPNQAVILGTDEHNGSTLVPLPTTEARAVVDAMWVKGAGTPEASGGSTPVKLTTGPNPDGGVQVGIYEELSGGAGAQWRAGIWVSAFVAATALGKDLTDFSFTASSGGYIDGASASGLMAGGFLAALTGAPIDPTATMTGIINPDGTIGPVAGIPEKFLGSIEKGKRRLGYPIGMRTTKSEATGKDVDLVQLAHDHGAEAFEIADVHEAYKLLTGKELPEPLPVAEADMAIDADTRAALDGKYKQWQAKVAAEWATLAQMESAGKLPDVLVALREHAQTATAQAEKLHAAGKVAAAYMKILAAWAYASGATRSYAILGLVQKGDVAGAAQQIRALTDDDEETTEVLKKVGAMRPTTLGGHLLMMSAYQSVLRAWGFQGYQDTKVKLAAEYLDNLQTVPPEQLTSPEMAEPVLGMVVPAVLFSSRTTVGDELALEKLEFEKEPTVNYMCSIPNVKRMSTSYQSAAAAGINYFDQLLVTPTAQQHGLSEDQAREQVMYIEPEYLVAYVTSRVQETEGALGELKKTWGEGSFAWNLLALASHELAYFDTAQLIAKYYSVDVHTDPSGRPDRVEHAQAFANMLASAERSARENARAARIATGGIPVQAKLAYEVASAERDGDLSDRFDALSQFWMASAFSQTAVMLARN